MKWFIPPLLWLILLPITPQIDLAIESYFYGDGGFQNTPLFQYLFDYATYPALITAGAGGVLFLLSFPFKSLARYRRPGLYFMLVLVIGSGLIINAGLKDHWGQPRPRELVEFGGTEEYRAVWQPNFGGPGKAFPCGHCSMGFFFFALCFLGRHFIWPGAFIAFTLGGVLSYIRMAQGGHYFSGVITSALIMWLVAFLLSPILYEEKH